MKAQVVEEKPIPMALLKQKLEEKMKKEELNFRANKTLEYLQQATILDTKKAEELLKKIEALKIPRIKEDAIVKIVDLLPETPEKVRLILADATISKENIDKIAKTVSEYSKTPKKEKEEKK